MGTLLVRQEDADSSLKAYETSVQTAGRRMVGPPGISPGNQGQAVTRTRPHGRCGAI